MSVLTEVRAGFILKETTLKGWCRQNGIDPGYGHKAVSGALNGPAARALKARIVAAATAFPHA